MQTVGEAEEFAGQLPDTEWENMQAYCNEIVDDGASGEFIDMALNEVVDLFKRSMIVGEDLEWQRLVIKRWDPDNYRICVWDNGSGEPFTDETKLKNSWLDESDIWWHRDGEPDIYTADSEKKGTSYVDYLMVIPASGTETTAEKTPTTLYSTNPGQFEVTHLEGIARLRSKPQHAPPGIKSAKLGQIVNGMAFLHSVPKKPPGDINRLLVRISFRSTKREPLLKVVYNDISYTNLRSTGSAALHPTARARLSCQERRFKL